MGIFVQGKSFGKSNNYVMKKDISITNSVEALFDTSSSQDYEYWSGLKWDRGNLNLTPNSSSGIVWTINIDISAIELFTDFTFSQISNEEITTATLFSLEDVFVGYGGIRNVKDTDGNPSFAYHCSAVEYASISHFFYYTFSIENGILKINFHINMANYSTLTSLPRMDIVSNGVSVMRDGFAICRVTAKIKYNGKYVIITDSSKISSNYPTPAYNSTPSEGTITGSYPILTPYYSQVARDAINAGYTNYKTFKTGDKLTDYSSSSRSIYFYWLFAPKTAYGVVGLTENLGTGYLEYET